MVGLLVFLEGFRFCIRIRRWIVKNYSIWGNIVGVVII